jgi:preprotein translocase subunit YajC
MNITSNKWLLPILIIVILILSGYFIVDYYNHLTQDASCDNQGNGTGPGYGQGRNISNVYNLLIAFIIIIIILIPILYFLITRNLQKQLKDNKRLISEITESNGKNIEQQDTDKSQKMLLLKFLNYGENQVIKKLIENNGTILQSEISRMPNMGKVRSHRIITDLKKKEIITIEKHGKTNQINLTEDAKNVLLK